MKKLKDKIEDLFDNVIINDFYQNRIFVKTNKESVVSLLNYLKELGYDHLALVSCVDHVEENEFELVYILSAYIHNEHENQEKTNIIIKTRISREKAKFTSIINLFENAEPYEREIFELFGVDFVGHPRLKPLFLEINYETPPFRKDFDTRKFVDDFFANIPIIEEIEDEK